MVFLTLLLVMETLNGLSPDKSSDLDLSNLSTLSSSNNNDVTTPETQQHRSFSFSFKHENNNDIDDESSSLLFSNSINNNDYNYNPDTGVTVCSRTDGSCAATVSCVQRFNALHNYFTTCFRPSWLSRSHESLVFNSSAFTASDPPAARNAE